MKRRNKLIGRVAYTFFLPLWLIVAGRRPPRAYMQIECDDEILLVQNWLGSGRWSYPGGGIHKGEDSRVGVCREVYEEVGLRIMPKDIELLKSGKTKYLIGYKRYIFYRVSLKKRPKITLDLELNGYVWVKKSQIKHYKVTKDLTSVLAEL